MSTDKPSRRNPNRRRAVAPINDHEEVEAPRGVSGPRAYYRPKVKGVSFRLTEVGAEALDAVVARTEASHGDIFEQLLRRFGARVRFTEGGLS